MAEKKTIYLIVGRTSTGKSRIASEICNKLSYKQVKSFTTRPPRESEINHPEKCDHFFITDEEAEQYRDDIAAYTEINGYKYFATKQILAESDVYVIDPNGIEDLKRRCPDEFNFVVLYIRVPKSVGKRRVIQRGESVEDYYKRYRSEDEQFSDFETSAAWDFLIINDDEIEIAILQALRAIQKAQCKENG